MCIIFEENSTPIVWEERTRPALHDQYGICGTRGYWRGLSKHVHSFFTNRCKRHDLFVSCERRVAYRGLGFGARRTFQRRWDRAI